MRYYKMTDGGYITAIGTGSGGEEITEAAYAEIKNIIDTKPAAPAGYDYRLTTALSWEQHEAPLPDEPALYTQETLAAMTNAELEQLLYGFGFTGGMNKANMIRLILLAQGGAVL